MGEAAGIVKNTGVLFMGRVTSLAMKTVYIAILARYILAEGVGQIGTAESLVGILALLTTFGLPTLLTRDIAANRDHARTHLGNAVWIMLGLSALMAVALAIIIGRTDYPPVTVQIIWLYGAVYVLDALASVNTAAFQAYEKMAYPALLQVGRDAFNVAVSLVAVYMQSSLQVIVAISVAASAFKWLASLALLQRRFVRVSFRPDRHILRTLLINSLPFAVLAVLLSSGREINTFVLSLHYPEAVVGLYVSASMLINYASILPNVFLQAIFPVFSRLRTASQQALQATYRRAFRWLLIVGMPMGVGLAVIAAPLVRLVYGADFTGAATALVWMSPIVMLMPNYANGAFMNATGRQKLFAQLTAVEIALTLALCLALVPRYGYVGASIAATIPRALVFVPLTVVCHRALELRLPWSLTGRVALGCVAMAGISRLALANQVHFLIVAALIAPVVYVAVLSLLGVWTKDELAVVQRVWTKAAVTRGVR